MKILPSEFDGQPIRRVFDEDLDVWCFSVIDVVQVLTESKSAKRYWSDLKRKLAQEAGSGQPHEEIVRLKLTATDGKQRETDCAKAATLLRIVQSIPAPKPNPSSSGWPKLATSACRNWPSLPTSSSQSPGASRQ
jgi:DNA-damage-inducible protein D